MLLSYVQPYCTVFNRVVIRIVLACLNAQLTKSRPLTWRLSDELIPVGICDWCAGSASGWRCLMSNIVFKN
jgi:hypothetical protein